MQLKLQTCDFHIGNLNVAVICISCIDVCVCFIHSQFVHHIQYVSTVQWEVCVMWMMLMLIPLIKADPREWCE